jgi:hypothetical protein
VPKTGTYVVAFALSVAAMLGGCGVQRGGSSTGAATATTTATVTATTSGDGPLPTESGEPPGPEISGTETPDSGEADEVTVSLPGLPIGGQSGINAREEACVEVAYLGGEEHRIPDGARVLVTRFRFSSDLLVVEGNGCGSGRRDCRDDEGAFTDQARNCVLPVQTTREPTPAPGQEDDGDVSEDVSLAMDATVHCASDGQQRCADFVEGVRREPADQTVSITVLQSSSSEPEQSSQTTSTQTTAEPSSEATSESPSETRTTETGPAGDDQTAGPPSSSSG